MRGPGLFQAGEFEILRYADGVFAWEKDLVVEERRAEIYVNGRPYVSVMATPAQLDSLAIGYLFTEGLINDMADLGPISVDGLRVDVEVRKELEPPPDRARSAGFGLGSVAIKDIQKENFETAGPDPPLIAADSIVTLMEEFNQLSELFRKTGAVHSSWLVAGERRYFAEDVGRHNALDKVIGQYLADGRPSAGQPGLIWTTGRISIEMLLKTARAGMAALISRGAASRLAVEFAEKLNVVLIGFARGDQFKAFHGGRHLSAPDQGEAAND